MGWETRGPNGRRYYYRSRREGGRVVKEYVGRCDRDPVHRSSRSNDIGAWWGEYQALVAEGEVMNRASERVYHAREERRHVAKWKRTAAQVADYSRAVDAVVAALLEASGYHRHKRGEWRKRRGTSMSSAIATTAAEAPVSMPPALMCPAYPPAPLPDSHLPAIVRTEDGNLAVRLTNDEAGHQMGDALERSKAGDVSSLPGVRAFFEAAAEPGRRLPYVMEAAREVEAAMIRSICPAKKRDDEKPSDNLMRAECLRLELQQVKESLAGPNPSPLEVLLVERAALCWLHVQQIEVTLQNANRLVNQGRVTGRLMDTYYSRLNGAQKRFLAAVKVLAQVRRLQLPHVTAVQVNIGTGATGGTGAAVSES